MLMRLLIPALASVVFAFTALAGAEEHQRTRQLPEGGRSPAATLDQVAWIAGHWEGEAFGGTVEEIWSPPRGGSMMCMFRLIVGGETEFYEFVALRQVAETLLLQLKHFHGDLKGWEERDETIDFPLVALEDGAAYFAGFTFERISEDEMTIWVLIDGADGAEEVPFRYRRMP